MSCSEDCSQQISSSLIYSAIIIINYLIGISLVNFLTSKNLNRIPRRIFLFHDKNGTSKQQRFTNIVDFIFIELTVINIV